jgi:hemoglobin/transferrin/lactoferrin receptor protein
MLQRQHIMKNIPQHDQVRPRRIFRAALLCTTAFVGFAGAAYAEDAPLASSQNAPLAGSQDAPLASSENAPLAQGQNTDTLILAPIAIDAKADVITGGVQLDGDDIARLDPQDIRDVFRMEPGVTVGSPVQVSQKIFVNGIEDTNLAVDIDGARQANRTFHHIGTTVVDPSLLKAVKVETGVAPADAGPGALGGSITLETKEGRDLVAPGETIGGFGKLSYNSNTKGFSEELAAGVRYGNFDALLSGSNKGGKDYKDGNGDRVDGTRPRMDNYMLKAGYTTDAGYRFKVSATRFSDVGKRSGRPNFAIAGMDLSETDYRRNTYTFAFGHEKPSDYWDPKFSISYTKIKLDFLQNTTALMADVDTINAKASNTFTTDLGTITAGVDYYRDHGENATDLTETSTNYGLFAQARLSVMDDMRVSFGGRVDRNELEGADNSDIENTGLSGNANIEYDFNDVLMGYGGVSHTFGGVPLTEIGIMGIRGNAPVYTNLKPVKAQNYKIGLRYESGAFEVDGNLFSTRIDDALDLTATYRATTHTLLSQGGSISGKYVYGDGFVRAGYSHATVRDNGDVPNSTEANYRALLMGDNLSFEIGHAFPQYGIRVGSTNEYWFPNDDTEETKGETLKGYFVSNLYGEWSPEQVDGLTMRLDVKNLFDATYADRATAGYDSSRAGVGSFKEPGRSFVLTAKYVF